MDLSLIGFTLDVIGKVMVAYTAIRVHYRVRKEHSIDERVFKAMRKEQLIGILGIGLILIGFVLQVPSKL